MKIRFRFYVILMLTTLGGGACSSFLEENPTTRFSADKVYSSDETALAALNGLYTVLAVYGHYGQKIQVMLEPFSGIYGTAEYKNAGYVELARLNVSPAHSDNNALFVHIFQTINDCNDVLEKIEPARARGAISDAAYKRIKGETYFLRAFNYFDAVRIYGKVPLMLSTKQGPSPRAAIIDIYKRMLDDLKLAEENMLTPEEQAEQQIEGRPNRYAAIALRAKIYVAMACIAENPSEPFDATGFGDPMDYWKLAYDNAKIVYDEGPYRLVPLSELWDYYAGRNCAESIFEIQMSTASQTANGGFFSHYIPSYYEGCVNINSSNNASRIVILRETFDRHRERYTNSDPRFKYTYIYQTFKRNNAPNSPANKTQNIYPNGGMTNLNQEYNYPRCKKWIDPVTTNTSGSVNFKAYRYADLLLTLAEAANELGESDEAVDYVNEVLRRAREAGPAGTIEPADWEKGTMSRQQLRQAIMDERLYELHGELHEFYDVRRRGLQYFKKIVRNHNERLRKSDCFDYESNALINVRDYFWSESDYDVKKAMLLPIPLNEINNNEFITKNNFGY